MREVLELALEALEEFGEHYDWCHQFPTYAFPENYPPCNCGYDEAITAIKEALREHAMYEVQRLGQEIQPEQEPVALQMDVIVVNLVREGINKHRARELAEHFIKHTTPPQRKPLTDEEIQELFGVGKVDATFTQFVRAIEAAHGIKEQK